MVGQTSVQEEIDGVVGGQRMVSISDMSRLPLTEAVIMEVQRVRNILPLGVPHGTLQVRLFRVRSESTANEKKKLKKIWNSLGMHAGRLPHRSQHDGGAAAVRHQQRRRALGRSGDLPSAALPRRVHRTGQRAQARLLHALPDR